jgi:hypothetical protein
VILVDANVLLYAYNASAPQHAWAKAWLGRAFSAPGLVGLSWSAILAFIRIGTNPRAYTAPLSADEACEIVAEWLARPNVVVLEPAARHWTILAALLVATQARGHLVTDVHVAALAIEHGASLCTTDRDFALFERHGLALHDPSGAAG